MFSVVVALLATKFLTPPANAIVFLLSEGAAFISGTTINIDGGFHMAAPNYRLAPRRVDSPVYEGFHLAVAPKLAQKLMPKDSS